MKKYVEFKNLWNKIRSSMFLKKKVDSEGIFEILKVRLVSDGSCQDRICCKKFNLPTATLEVIFIELRATAKLKENGQRLI